MKWRSQTGQINFAFKGSLIESGNSLNGVGVTLEVPVLLTATDIIVVGRMTAGARVVIPEIIGPVHVHSWLPIFDCSTYRRRETCEIIKRKKNVYWRVT